ncbi:MAG: type II toxin-antitoxin system Phd/YefM family antitoxin [Oscillospiraceae bacterium]|jgi:PHD/YefM family antitoxin component YafN of YafNO toxin-antitoxin module|nr:type II toxin-antitoxin system Phd/YefM family antitoxin [Oscillospiraceae bacterium]
MLDIIAANNALDAFVPISRFNRGEAGRIFDEVRSAGCKIVVKNNAPVCVLLAPEQYREMMDLIEDHYLLALAEERMKNGSGVTYPAAEVYARLGIKEDELNEIPMEYGVDFE